MARRAPGTIEIVALADGAQSFRGRFTHAGQRYRVCFGRDDDGWTAARARRELDDVLAQLRAGIAVAQNLARYDAPVAEPQSPAANITFHEYASEWLRRR